MSWRRCLWLCALLLASGCSTGSVDTDTNPVADLEEITITPEVDVAYQHWVAGLNPLVFVVSADGKTWSSMYCHVMGCTGTIEQMETATLSDCNSREGNHGPCSPFAIRRNPPRKYKVADMSADEPSGGVGASGDNGASTSNDSPPSSQGELTITPRVAQEYEECQRTINPLMFAVSSDGRTSYCVHCTSMACQRPDRYEMQAIAGCNDRYAETFKMKNGRCSVFAVGRGKPKSYKVANEPGC
jgi:hypothetical protein